VDESFPGPARLLVGTSDNQLIAEQYSDIEQACKRYRELRNRGYFCWVHDTKRNANVSP
jgi:hypothetical protein